MIKKLRKHMKKYFSSPQHIRTVSIVVLLIIILAIPLTVFIVQQQQDIRQHAAEPGFQQVTVSGCGEILSQPAIGATTGDFVFQAPIRTKSGWETHKADGGIITTSDLYKKMWDQFNTEMNLSRTIEEFTISCTAIIRSGGDCRAEVVGHGTSKEDMLAQGERTTIHMTPNTGESAGCEETVLIRAQHGSSPPASYPQVTPFQWPAGISSRWCTDSDGGKVYDQVAIVTNNVDPATGDPQNCDNNGNCTDVDACENGALTEYYCETGLVKKEQYTCSNGCADKWSCKNNGTPLPTGMMPSGGVTPSISLTPMVTVTVTPSVVATPTATPIASGSGIPTPTLTLTPTSIVPTPTLPSTPTMLAVTVALPGIGKNGNVSPNNGQRRVSVELVDSANKAVGASVYAQLSFDPGSGKFKGTANFGTVVPSGNYVIKLKTNQYLAKKIPATVVTAGVTNTIPQATLISGDINNDNKLDILDYNILVGCFGKKINSESCGIKKVDADLNDDGVIDGIDYNLFLLGIKTAKVGD